MECARYRRGRTGSASRMNCFRHPDEVAIVFCKACRLALCRECSQQSIRGVTHVCSDECAQTVRRRPGAKVFFDNVYAGVFLIILLAVFFGGFCVLLAHSGRVCWERQQNPHYLNRDQYGGLEVDLYKLFHFFGIEDWRMHFVIGATVGVVGAVIWLRRYWRPAIPDP
jgi:B-box zinc finger